MSEPSKRLRIGLQVAAVGSGVLLLVVGLVIAVHLQGAKADAAKRHAARLSGSDDSPAAEGTGPVMVKAGFYVDRIASLDVAAAS